MVSDRNTKQRQGLGKGPPKEKIGHFRVHTGFFGNQKTQVFVVFDHFQNLVGSLDPVFSGNGIHQGSDPAVGTTPFVVFDKVPQSLDTG